MKFDEFSGLYVLDALDCEAIGYDESDMLPLFDKQALLHAIAVSRSEITSIEANNIQDEEFRYEFMSLRHGWLGRLEDMECELSGKNINSGIVEAAQSYIDSF